MKLHCGVNLAVLVVDVKGLNAIHCERVAGAAYFQASECSNNLSRSVIILFTILEVS
jgi:hypothetical protein